MSRDEGAAFARKHGCLFVETSAKANVAVGQAFEELVRKVRCLLRRFLNSLILHFPVLGSPRSVAATCYPPVFKYSIPGHRFTAGMGQHVYGSACTG